MGVKRLVPLLSVVLLLSVGYFLVSSEKVIKARLIHSQQNLNISWVENWSGLRIIYEVPKEQVQNPNGLTLDVEIPTSVVDWLEAYVDSNNITHDLEETLTPQVYYYSDYDNSQDMVKFGIYHYVIYNNTSIPDKIIISNLNLKGGSNWRDYNHYIVVYYPLLWFDNFEKYSTGINALSGWVVDNYYKTEISYYENDKVLKAHSWNPDYYYLETKGEVYKLLHIPVSSNWSALYLLAGVHYSNNGPVRITIWFKTKENTIKGVSFASSNSIDHVNNQLGTICYTKIINSEYVKENVLYYLTSECGTPLNDLSEIYGISITLLTPNEWDSYIRYIGLTVEQK